MSLEEELATLSDKDLVLITGGGTSAIYLALQASTLPPGAYIAVPNICCPDPVYALIWAGYKPYFIDVNPDDFNIDVAQLEQAAVSGIIKGVIAVHLFGNPCEIDRVQEICSTNDLFLIEDCAQALGNHYKDKALGSFGDVSIYSFGNGKIVEAGHGGSLQTNDEALFVRATEMQSQIPEFNIATHDKKAVQHRTLYYKLYNATIKWPFIDILNRLFLYIFRDYYIFQFSEAYRSDIIEKITSLPENRRARIEIVKGYYAALKGQKKIILPKIHDMNNALSRLTIRVEESEKISLDIRNSGISSNTMYPPLASRFQLFPVKKNISVSRRLRGTLLNLWTNDVSDLQLKKVLKLLTNEKS